MSVLPKRNRIPNLEFPSPFQTFNLPVLQSGIGFDFIPQFLCGLFPFSSTCWVEYRLALLVVANFAFLEDLCFDCLVELNFSMLRYNTIHYIICLARLS